MQINLTKQQIAHADMFYPFHITHIKQDVAFKGFKHKPILSCFFFLFVIGHYSSIFFLLTLVYEIKNNCLLFELYKIYFLQNNFSFTTTVKQIPFPFDTLTSVLPLECNISKELQIHTPMLCQHTPLTLLNVTWVFCY